MRSFVVPALMIAALAAPAFGSARETRQARGEAELAKEIAGRVPGKPRDCLPLTSIESSHVIEGTAILYRAYGGTLYVNRPSGAEMLHDDDIPVQFLHGSEMCNLDRMNLVDRAGGFPRGFASLGVFVPYPRPDRAH